MNTSKKLGVSFFIGLLIAGGVGGIPRAAHAQFGASLVFDPANLIQNTVSAVTASKQLLNPVFYQIAQRAIDSMVQSTVNWINTGFQGSPAYATDLKSTLQDAADQEVEGFIRQFRANVAINSPFRDLVGQNVLRNYYLSSNRDSFALQNPYTLNQASRDDKAFLRGDFTQGGFSAWLSASLNSQNNPIGALNNAQNELARRVAGVQGQIHEELGWGNGIFSFRKCDQQGAGTATNSNTIVGADGKLQTVELTSLTPSQTCLSSHIETPGSIISSKINQSLGLGAESLVQADQFDEIVNALIAQMLKNVLGPTGLGGVSRPSTASGGRTYFDQTVTDNTSAGVAVASSFLTIIDGEIAELQQYQANWQKLNGAALAAKTALSGACAVNGEATIAAEVQPVITQAATAFGKTTPLLTSLTALRTKVIESAAADNATRNQAFAEASSEHDALLAQMPLGTDIREVEAQALDSTDPLSTYTRMNQLAAQAQCGT